ncbi:MAG: PQQ-binding-like beta-propeller repeat protein [Acidimicrobiales bacterium]
MARRRTAGAAMLACAAVLAACTGSSGSRGPVEPTTTIASAPQRDAPTVSIQPLLPSGLAPPDATPCGPFPPRRAAVVAVDGTGAIRWEVPLEPGRYGGAGPLVDDRRVYTTAGAEVRALDLASGDERWRAPAGGEIYHAWLTGSTVTLVARDPGKDGRLLALRRTDGSTAWEWLAPGAGIYGDPFLLGTDAIAAVTMDGELVVRDLSSGDVRWSVPGNRQPGVVAAAGVVVRADEGLLRAYRARDGAALWTIAADVRRYITVTADTVVGSTSNGVQSFGLFDGAPRTSYSPPGPTRSSWTTDAGLFTQVGWPRPEWQLTDPATGDVKWHSEVTGQLNGPPLVLGADLVTLEDPGDSRTQIAARRLSDGVVGWGVVFDGSSRTMVARAGGGVLAAGSAPGQALKGQLTAVGDGEVLWSAVLPELVERAPAALADGGAVVQVVTPVSVCANSGSSAAVPAVSG